MKTFIFRADDAGSSLSANKAIYKVIKNKIVKNVSLMACTPYIADFYNLTKGMDICFGLHVTINSEWDFVKWGPISKIDKSSNLVDDNNYFLSDFNNFTKKSDTIKIILNEIKMQHKKLIDIGYKISYLDTHMLPEIYIEGLSEELDKYCLENSLINHKYYYNLPSIKGSSDIFNDLGNLPDNQYFFVIHPSLNTKEMRLTGNTNVKGSVVAKNRARETKMFSSKLIKRILFNNCQIKSIKYSEAIPFSYNTILKTIEEGKL
ncbi:MAG: ChbG/HpnK family deacetylase [Acholeplasmatales bacterium]|jgi:hypothetical protein|nr:ChbG/HpnK family deacetylase [Acholeplasmatales bacterium]